MLSKRWMLPNRELLHKRWKLWPSQLKFFQLIKISQTRTQIQNDSINFGASVHELCRNIIQTQSKPYSWGVSWMLLLKAPCVSKRGSMTWLLRQFVQARRQIINYCQHPHLYLMGVSQYGKVPGITWMGGKSWPTNFSTGLHKHCAFCGLWTEAMLLNPWWYGALYMSTLTCDLALQTGHTPWHQVALSVHFVHLLGSPHQRNPFLVLLSLSSSGLSSLIMQCISDAIFRCQSTSTLLQSCAHNSGLAPY